MTIAMSLSTLQKLRLAFNAKAAILYKAAAGPEAGSLRRGLSHQAALERLSEVLTAEVLGQ